MALHKSELMTGGTPTETVLWINSSPTSAFNQQYVEKTQLPSYDQLKVTFRISTSNSNTKSVILDMSEFIKNYPYFAAYYWGSDGTGVRMFVRPFYSANSGIRSAVLELHKSIYKCVRKRKHIFNPNRNNWH